MEKKRYTKLMVSLEGRDLLESGGWLCPNTASDVFVDYTVGKEYRVEELKEGFITSGGKKHKKEIGRASCRERV